MTANKNNNKSKWTAAGAAAKAVASAKDALTPASVKSEPAAPAAAKSAPAAESVKSEPVAAAPVARAPVEGAVVKSEPVAAAPVLEPAAALEPITKAAKAAIEIVELETAPVVEAQKAAAALVVSAATPGATPEAAAWAFKGVELWSENAQAMLGFVSELGKAKSLTEVVELQSRFATERFNRFAKLASEVAPPQKFFFFAA